MRAIQGGGEERGEERRGREESVRGTRRTGEDIYKGRRCDVKNQNKRAKFSPGRICDLLPGCCRPTFLRELQATGE